tara:strand:+ start:346 stop:612 length:267 start_codon:yes stop_codon:yes gene_type:complete
LGLRINESELSRNSATAIIKKILADINFRMFDCLGVDSHTLVIIRINLKDIELARERVGLNTEIESLTTSGKIRLVRNRMGLSRLVRK